MQAIGIDFGTSTSEICIFHNDLPTNIPDSTSKKYVIPSVVAVNRSGELIVGENATSYPDAIWEIKRKLGTSETIRLRDKSYTPTELAALIIRHVKQQAQYYIGSEVTEAVLSVPANYSQEARNATKEAGTIAGLKINRLISEPTAAAISYGYQNMSSDDLLLVYDFGGGTLDVSIVEAAEGILDVKATSGDPKLGGKDFDDVIIQIVKEKFIAQYPNTPFPENETTYAELKKKAKETKETLSEHSRATYIYPRFALKNSSLIDLEIDVYRQEFEKRCQQFIDRSKNVIDNALKKAEITKEQITSVLLVGGTTYIPFVREHVEEYFHKKLTYNKVNPDLAVSIGACLQHAVSLDKVEDKIIVLDVSPFGLGTRCVEWRGGQIVGDQCYAELIAPNTRIPFSCTHQYSLIHEEQNEVEIDIYQSKTANVTHCSNAVFTGISTLIKDIPPSEDGTPHAITVNFSYDISGLIQLEAIIPATGQKAYLTVNHNDTRLSQQDIRKSRMKIEDAFDVSHKYESLIKMAKEFMEGMEPTQAGKLNKLIVSLESAINRKDETTSEVIADSITNIIF